ncbi:replication factor rfa1 [Saccharata proteae CBS 121410]|uniref:Replication protein A subunit n=1 Tax=Saccharata proteae CBS 121410 TaxID=1314787 RepID=A0A9P4LZS2_9PEZI|nr:replication factor rfa1 [Saccharata proteae CBS 121410]
MAEQVITRGALRAIWTEGAQKPSEPILQCVQIKAMDSKGGEERYRVVLSDTDNFIQSMLAQQVNTVITSGLLKKGSIIRLKQFNPQVIKERKILVILDLDVLEEYGESEKIGEPKALEAAPVAKSASPAIPQQPAEIGGSGFYGNRPVKQEKSLPSRSNIPNAPPSGLANLYPIEALSPYTHKWTIKARCTHKSDIKTWHNKNGEGKLFSATFLDESGEIRATAFKDQCDMLYDVVQEGSVYYISNCSVKLAKKQFSNVNNDYELTFQNDSIVEKAEDQDSVPQVRFNFTGIGDLQSVEPNSTIDTIGILKEVGETSEITSKTTGKPFEKRELTLVDNSMTSVRLTVWGNSAKNFDAPLESVLAFKGVKVSDFGGRSLSLLSSGSMAVDPDIDDAHKLKGWYDASGRNDQYTTHQSAMGATGGKPREYKTIQQIRDEELGMSEEAHFFNLKATIIYVKHDNFAYPACLSEGCNKKVVETEPGRWRCERCDVLHDRPQYRYIMQCNVSDHTGQLWLSCFDESGQQIMGMTADQMTAMKEAEGQEQMADQAFVDATCQTWVFNVKAKMETFQDTPRMRYQVSRMSPLNFPAECAKLTEMIKAYDMNDSLFVN